MVGAVPRRCVSNYPSRAQVLHIWSFLQNTDVDQSAVAPPPFELTLLGLMDVGKPAQGPMFWSVYTNITSISFRWVLQSRKGTALSIPNRGILNGHAKPAMRARPVGRSKRLGGVI